MNTTTADLPLAGELCAGYGGLALAGEAAFGVRTEWVVEFDQAPSKALAHNFEHARNYCDITRAPWEAMVRVSLLTGGTPCQELSVLGRRAGMVDGTRSGLWASMAEAVRVQRPEWVGWENVRGALSSPAASATEYCPECMGGTPGRPHPVLRALGRVVADLVDLGYDVEWRCIRASDVGAAHHRMRVFVLAHRAVPGTPSPELPELARWNAERDVWEQEDGRMNFCGHASVFTRAWPQHGAVRAGVAYERAVEFSGFEDLPVLRTPCAAEAEGGPLSRTVAAARNQTLRLTGQVLSLWHPGLLEEVEGTELRAPGWHEFGPAIERWERIMGTPCPPPTIAPGTRRPYLNPAFVEWLMGLPTGWVSGLVAHEDPAKRITWQQALKMLGNGVCPAQAAAAFGQMREVFQAEEEALALAA